MSQCQLQDVISKCGVPGQEWAVGIGADDRAGDRALCAVVAVADPNFDGGKRRHTGSESGIATMVLESGQPLFIAVSAVPAADDLTDRTNWAAGGRDVQQSKAGDHVVLVADGEAVTDDLVTSADGKDGGPAIDRAVQPAVSLERPYGRDLGRIFAPT